MSPDAYGNFKGISIPRLPWKEEEQVEVINREQQEYDRVRNGVPPYAVQDLNGGAHPNRDKPSKGR